MATPDHPTATPATDPFLPTCVASEEFVHAMGRHVSSVCVIATCVAEQRFGLTATAMSSVCSNPPRLLVCVNKSGVTHDKIIEARHFSVNVLAEDQDRVAKVFAGMATASGDRFEAGTWRTLVTGSPCLADAVSVFDCRMAFCCEQPTHTVFFGDVVATGTSRSAEPLLYGLKRFRHIRKTHLAASGCDLESLHF